MTDKEFAAARALQPADHRRGDGDHPATTPAPAADLTGFDTGRCYWSQDGDGGPWATGCSNYFEINDGPPSANGMKFCCYCGKPLDEIAYSEDDNE